MPSPDPRQNAEGGEACPDWLLAVVIEFSPKVIPLDVTPDGDGTYSESETRWGMSPVYEAIPEPIRDAAEQHFPESTRRYWRRLRG